MVSNRLLDPGQSHDQDKHQDKDQDKDQAKRRFDNLLPLRGLRVSGPVY